MKYIFPLIILIGTIGCQTEINKDQIIGKWQVIEFESDIPSYSYSVIEESRIEAVSRNYTFKDKGESYVKSKRFPNGKIGNWTFDSDNNSLVIRYTNNDDNGQEQYTVESVTESKMILTEEIGYLGTLTLTLLKQ